MSIALRQISGLPETLNAAFRKAWSGTWDVRLYRIGITLSLVIGVILRLSGQYFDQSSLWFDEAAWANRALDRAILDMPIRPIAFMWLSKQIVVLFGTTEFWFRFLPNTASFVALGFMPYVASQLLQSRVSRFVLVLLWALQPALIDYAKEFKPYSFEVMVHLVPLILYLRYRQTGKFSYFLWMMGCLPVLFLFTYNLAFTFPGVLLWGLVEGYRQRKLRGAAAAVVSGALCLGLIGSIYTLTLNKVSTSQNESYWGRKYDVFYTKVQEDEGHSRAAWMAEKYNDMAALPGLRREVWHPPAFVPKGVVEAGIKVDRLLWLGLHLAGIAYLLLRRRELFVLLVVPYLVLIALNVVGRWPIGAFRTNVFLCTYMLPLAAIGLDWIARRTHRHAAAALAVVAAVTLVPAFAYGFDFGEKKSFWGARNHEARELIQMLVEHREEHLRQNPKMKKEYLLFDCHMSYSFRYYMTIHPEYKAKYADYFKKNFDLSKGCSVGFFNRTLRSRLRRPGDPFWVVASKRAVVESTPPTLRRSARILFETKFGTPHFDDHLVYYVESRKERKKGSNRPKGSDKAAPKEEASPAKAEGSADSPDDEDAPEPAPEPGAAPAPDDEDEGDD